MSRMPRCAGVVAGGGRGVVWAAGSKDAPSRVGGMCAAWCGGGVAVQ